MSEEWEAISCHLSDVQIFGIMARSGLRRVSGREREQLALDFKTTRFIPELDLHDVHTDIITRKSEMHAFPFFKAISLNRQLLDQISFTKISSHMALWETLQFLKNSEESRCPKD